MTTSEKDFGDGHLDWVLKRAFNEEYYTRIYPDARLHPEGALRHFLDIGWKSGRDPTPGFSIRGYVMANPDVAKSGINPFVQYLMYGLSEGRTGHAREATDRPILDFKTPGDLAQKILSLSKEDFDRANRTISDLSLLLNRLKS